MFEDLTFEGIRNEMLKEISGVDKREGSYTANVVSGVALELWNICKSLDAVIPIAFVDETSGSYIDLRAGEFQIYRKPGAKASVVLDFTGDDGAVIPEGSVFLTVGGLEFVTVEAAQIADGKASANAVAAVLGTKGNVSAGTVVRRATGDVGIKTVTNPKAASGGSDMESDKSLVDRLYAFWRKPITSGNAYSYEKWACEVDGVHRARILPLWNGNGTVKVLLAGEGGRPVDDTVVARCAGHIERERPIGATVTVASATPYAVNISAYVRLNPDAAIADIEQAYRDKLALYLQSMAFQRYELLYNRFACLLMDLDGVVDHQMLAINGGTVNMMVPEDAVPTAGTVVLSPWT